MFISHNATNVLYHRNVKDDSNGNENHDLQPDNQKG